ncbi:MAG: replicative DNA helicase [Candidatus Thiodiazotropha sp. (ex Semelilucina semeliformis)]|nr:replicative DNA helicase [Candidatus Thiodiazotropha sp. (ex Semelilucina semeliformis)]
MTNHLRTPPHSAMAEKSVLGGLMLVNGMWPAVSEILGAEDFYLQAHQTIFAAMEGIEDKRQPIDLVTIAEQLEKTNKIEEIGGITYLVQLADQTPGATNIIAYARSVREHADHRKLISIGRQISEAAFGQVPIIEIVNDAEAAFLKLTEQASDVGPHTISEIVGDGYLDELEKRATGATRGLPTRFIDFDRLTNGMRPGQLIVIAGRPGLGKSTLALNIAENLAIKDHQPALVFSLEMSREEIMDRLIASVGSIPLDEILQGNLDRGDFSGAIQAVNGAPLYIDDGGGLYINQIRARALRIKRKHGLSLLVIDYLQLVRAKAESRFQEVSEVSRALKALAKELRVPVIALSQLNRDIESRPNGKPRLSDLRESGQLEQDADLIGFLYREDIKADVDVVTLAIEKQRNGPTGKVHLAARLKYSRFDNYAGRIVTPLPPKDFYNYEN